MQIHERMVTLRQQVSSLDLIVSIYNNVQRTLTPIERPLLEPRLATVDATLQRGLLVSTPALSPARAQPHKQQCAWLPTPLLVCFAPLDSPTCTPFATVTMGINKVKHGYTVQG